MGERPEVDVKVKHYASVLRHAIRAAGFSVREVERVLGMAQEEFFVSAARGRRQRSPSGELLASFERGDHAAHGDELEPLADAARDPGDAGSEDEFDRLVEEAVDRVIERRAREGRPLPPLPPPESLGPVRGGRREGDATAGAGGEPR
jgi:hypothetical protein